MLQVLDCTEVKASGGGAAPGKHIIGARQWVVFLGRMTETALTAQTPVPLAVAPPFSCHVLDQATRNGRVSTRSKGGASSDEASLGTGGNAENGNGNENETYSKQSPKQPKHPLEKHTDTIHKLPTIKQHPDEESNKKSKIETLSWQPLHPTS